MKKILKLLVSVTLIIAMVMTFASCHLFGKNQNNRETYVVETYEEAMAIIEVLKSYGNEIPRKIISSYENEQVDAKYTFIVDVTNTEKQAEGKEWSERKFFAIRYIRYEGVLTTTSSEQNAQKKRIILKERSLGEDFAVPESLIFECHKETKDKNDCFLKRSDDGTYVVGVVYSYIENHLEELPEGFHEEFAKSIVFLVD